MKFRVVVLLETGITIAEFRRKNSNHRFVFLLLRLVVEIDLGLEFGYRVQRRTPLESTLVIDMILLDTTLLDKH